MSTNAFKVINFPTSRRHRDDRVPNQIDLAVVLPTFNERGNVAELIKRLSQVLSPLRWEIIFVDDDSDDGTSQEIERFAKVDRRIRLIRRIGRRGLSSACIEGVLATTATCVAVMDADLQHDESALLRMYDHLRSHQLDVVVATRNASGGSMGDFARGRVLLSRAGRFVSSKVCRCEVSDPMSGYFVFSRSFFLSVVHRMNGAGFKILIDMLASSKAVPKIGEVGYRFRQRVSGVSKLNVNVAFEYLFLILDKLSNGRLPPTVVAFYLVGGTGMALQLLTLELLRSTTGLSFHMNQLLATYLVMIVNFLVNNQITFRDRRLSGRRLVTGFVQYLGTCSLGACANATLAQTLNSHGSSWVVASIVGTGVSAVWNYAMASLFTWQKPLQRNASISEFRSIQDLAAKGARA